MSTKKQKKLNKALAKKKAARVHDLFDNPMVRSAMNSMSVEELEKYKALGESMYGDVDFEQSEVLSSLPPPMAEALAYIVEGLKSGLHPTDLDDDEKALLEESYGKEWYKRFHYTEADLKNI